jgi:hypothetical protein
MSHLSERKKPITFRPALRYYMLTIIIGSAYAACVYLLVSYDMIQIILERFFSREEFGMFNDIPTLEISTYINYFFIAIILVPIVRIIHSIWDAKFTITANELVIRRNILTKSVNITNWESIDGFRVHQSLAGRIFNYGIIEFIYESAQAIHEMNLLYGVIDPDKFKDEFVEHLNEVKYL